MTPTEREALIDLAVRNSIASAHLDLAPRNVARIWLSARPRIFQCTATNIRAEFRRLDAERHVEERPTINEWERA